MTWHARDTMQGKGLGFVVLGCLVVLCSLVSSSTAAVQPISVTSENASTILSDQWMVKFYTSWCGHCKRLQPVYEEFTQLASSAEYKDTGVKVAKVDCGAQIKLCNHFGIRNYPTLLFMNNGRLHEFNEQDRSLQSLTRFALQGGWKSSIGFCQPAEDAYPFVRFFCRMERDFAKAAGFSLWYVILVLAGMCLFLVGVVVTFLYLILKKESNEKAAAANNNNSNSNNKTEPAKGNNKKEGAAKPKPKKVRKQD